ncbi:hypothetical protein [Granulicella tundricola]|uniref:Uncharacterized protein n=1 Tax=Granulicella tundricola (strain ATCC BAA-1859 / DSM 23138 / MP5ACTX9) TaxID=1198114 RepID=E8X7P1_GRATM|nr:hypothetical protein [Granulicella tundricola]ADW71475.1 hypothetical protein AciX9_4538 [Granulicella tundricola MP5ACTX9]
MQEQLESTPEETGIEGNELRNENYDHGFQAALDGEPYDPETQTEAWQKGWADANE